MQTRDREQGTACYVPMARHNTSTLPDLRPSSRFFRADASLQRSLQGQREKDKHKIRGNRSDRTDQSDRTDVGGAGVGSGHCCGVSGPSGSSGHGMPCPYLPSLLAPRPWLLAPRSSPLAPRPSLLAPGFSSLALPSPGNFSILPAVARYTHLFYNKRKWSAPEKAISMFEVLFPQATT
jgi:hypothetical protein